VRPLLDVYYRLSHLARELMKFGVVGSVAFVVDVGLFKLMLHLTEKPLTSKTVSTVVATTVAYAGNRTWTFRRRAHTGVRREYVLFFLLNGVGLAIALACLAVSHYVLDLTSRLADNIAANVVGLALGTMFRFWSYRRYVFPELLPEAAEPHHLRARDGLSEDRHPPR
jgi:putative flippase GtrA